MNPPTKTGRTIAADRIAVRDGVDQSYARRIERVVAALHAEPDKAWRLEDMAAIACFSPWHFHRVYRAVCGESAEETRRRLALHRAAGDLLGTSREIAAIARRAGYGSVASFVRAFARAYGRPPGVYRRARGAGLSNLKQEHAMTRHGGPTHDQGTGRERGARAYHVALSEEPARRLVGLPHRGDYQTIGQAFERLAALVHGAGLDPASPMIGVYYDDPASVRAADLRAFAAREATPGYAPPAPLEGRDLAGGPAASIVHKGPYAELPQAYEWFYRDWLASSGREPADAPPYEVYLNDPRATPPTEWLTRIVLPLKP